MGKVISIVSGKGGTGKTMFAANFGATLAMRGKKVLILDMDNGLRSMDLYLGLENHVVFNIMDVLSGMCSIHQAVVKDRRFDDLYLLAAAPTRDERDITGLHMEILLEKIINKYDYIIVDAPAGIGDGMDLSIYGIDMAVIITTPEIASIRDADIVDRMLIKSGIKNRCCILNRVDAQLMSIGAEPGISYVNRNLRVKLLGVVQYDDNIFIAGNRGIPIVLKRGTYIEKNFGRIADRILDSLEPVSDNLQQENKDGDDR